MLSSTHEHCKSYQYIYTEWILNVSVATSKLFMLFRHPRIEQINQVHACIYKNRRQNSVCHRGGGENGGGAQVYTRTQTCREIPQGDKLASKNLPC